MNRRALFGSGAAAAIAAPQPATAQAVAGNVIFLHVDGFGVNHWNATRTLVAGPDGRIEWDRLPHMAVYSGHMKDGLTGTSNGGATVHAFGVRVVANSFGMDGNVPIRSLSGFEGSIAREAMAGGRRVGLVNSGAVYEPGTAVFVASSERRGARAEITRLIVESGVHVHLAGGERWYLPRGVRGQHGDGAREDGLNLVETLRARGYTVVFTREELAAVPPTTERLWGIFAHDHTFNDRNEETLARQNLPYYVPTAPNLAEMGEAALRVLRRGPQGFLLVVEEEGGDNFGNANNAGGTLEAGARADQAVGVFRRFVAANRNTLLLTAADSDAGGLQVVGPGTYQQAIRAGQNVPERDRNGAPFDGQGGTATPAFLAAPDREGRRHPFAIAWATADDVSGAILVRGEGRNAEQISRAALMDNVDVYRLMYRTLFGREPA
jgi:alkaline phosphatase